MSDGAVPASGAAVRFGVDRGSGFATASTGPRMGAAARRCPVAAGASPRRHRSPDVPRPAGVDVVDSCGAATARARRDPGCPRRAVAGSRRTGRGVRPAGAALRPGPARRRAARVAVQSTVTDTAHSPARGCRNRPRRSTAAGRSSPGRSTRPDHTGPPPRSRWTDLSRRVAPCSRSTSGGRGGSSRRSTGCRPPAERTHWARRFGPSPRSAVDDGIGPSPTWADLAQRVVPSSRPTSRWWRSRARPARARRAGT